jgi:signal transduction histidine kinase
VVVAAGLLLAGLVEIWVVRIAPGPQWLVTVMVELSTVPLAWRRSNPWLAVIGASVACLLPVLVQPRVDAGSLGIAFAWLIAVHAVNAYRPAREAALGPGLFLVASTVLVVVTAPASVSSASNPLPNIVFGWAIFAAAAATGQVMARQRRRLVAERSAAAASSRDAERRLIARELHDVVAHGVAVMVVQAGAAQQLMARDPVKATEMLEAVQRTPRCCP